MGERHRHKKTHKKLLRYLVGGGKRRLEEKPPNQPAPKKFRSLEEFLASEPPKLSPDIYSHKLPPSDFVFPPLSKSSSEVYPEIMHSQQTGGENKPSMQIVSILERLERIETHLGIGN
tara:strand:+ start:2096 stop:2449 length:354 start_codon:yes stop_codon:yes gene_type:complete